MQTLMTTIHGSRLYGMDTPASDTDYKGIFMPPLPDLLLGNAPKEIRRSTSTQHEKNSSEDIDEVYFSLGKFIKMACKGETVAIDMLYSDNFDHCLMRSSPLWDDIVANRHRFISTSMKSFLGYARKQAHKYGVKGSRMGALEEVVNVTNRMTESKLVSLGEGVRGITPHKTRLMDFYKDLPVNEYCKFIWNKPNKTGHQFYEVLGCKYQLTISVTEFKGLIESMWLLYGERTRQAKDNEGVDWKAISHAMRAAYQLLELYKAGKIQYPLLQRDNLLDVKQGKYDFTTVVAPKLEQLIVDVEHAVISVSHKYPETVDTEWWNKWLFDTYVKYYGITLRYNQPATDIFASTGIGLPTA